MRIAIIGGGLFGCTAAIFAARAGHDVHLFEAQPALMAGASAATFARLHRGAHYPRSPETGRESRRAEASFRAEYGEAVIDGGQQFYIVAPGGYVTREGFRDFLHGEGLPFFEEDSRFELVEPRIDLAMLATLVRQKVAASGVTVRLDYRIDRRTVRLLRERFARIVIATYARANCVASLLGCEKQNYKFQVVEKPIIRLPEGFANTSMVVIDGPFGCIDPLDRTPYHVLGHVTDLVHAENTGHRPEIPAGFDNLLDRGMVAVSERTRFHRAALDLSRYIPGVERAEHVGSMFTVRAVLAGQEATDARPTLVERLDDQVFRIFSGKLGTAVRAAKVLLPVLAAERNPAYEAA